jgi:hypothetical protein
VELKVQASSDALEMEDVANGRLQRLSVMVQRVHSPFVLPIRHEFCA